MTTKVKYNTYLRPDSIHSNSSFRLYNYGGKLSLSVLSKSNNTYEITLRRSLINFDLSDINNISSAKLGLYLASNCLHIWYDWYKVLIRCIKVNRRWFTEDLKAGNKNGYIAKKGEPCWLEARLDEEEWSIPGCKSIPEDISSEVLDSFELYNKHKHPIGTLIELDITNAVIKDLDDGNEYGVLIELIEHPDYKGLLSQKIDSGSISFYSNKYGEEEYQPYLKIE